MEENKIGITIQDARKRKKLTQAKVEYRLGVNEAYVSNIETGVKQPSLHIFIQLVLLLEINANALFYGTEEDPFYTRVGAYSDGLAKISEEDNASLYQGVEQIMQWARAVAKKEQEEEGR